MAEHVLKTWPEYFRAVVNGVKTFELRKNDRDFFAGDVLVLKEWDPEKEDYTGYETTVMVTYVLKGGTFGLDEDCAILAINNFSLYDEDSAETIFGSEGDQNLPEENAMNGSIMIEAFDALKDKMDTEEYIDFLESLFLVFSSAEGMMRLTRMIEGVYKEKFGVELNAEEILMKKWEEKKRGDETEQVG